MLHRKLEPPIHKNKVKSFQALVFIVKMGTTGVLFSIELNKKPARFSNLEKTKD